eukprot:133437_1
MSSKQSTNMDNPHSSFSHSGHHNASFPSGSTPNVSSRKRSLSEFVQQNPNHRNEQVLKKQKKIEKKLTGLEAYEKLGKLGEGTYGIVYMARDRRTNEFVALKRIRTGLNNKKTGFPMTSIREIKILQNLDHCNIVSLREVVRSTNIGYIFLVFEYYQHDLASLMDSQSVRFTISEMKCIVLQLLSAIEYAHAHFVIHRDIKLSNILLNNNGNIVLCDWGLARLFSNPLKKHTSKVVTLWYRAPELLFGINVYHTAIDMWAVGCIVAELLQHKPLLPGKNEIQQIQLIYELLGAPNHHIWPNYMALPRIVDGTFKEVENPQTKQKYKWNVIDHLFACYKANCLDLMKQLLAYDPSKRITATNAIKHPFFKEIPLPVTKDMMPTFPAKVNTYNR